MTYVLAGSLGAVGVISMEDAGAIEEIEVEEQDPIDAEAPGEHVMRAFEQARAMVQ